MFEKWKNKKAEKIQQKNFEARMKIKQTLNKMKNQSSKLDSFKLSYIEKAKKASLEGDSTTYNLAKSGLKICLSKQRFLNQMITNFELSLEIADMNKVVAEFVGGVNTLGEQMQQVMSGVDMTNAKLAYDKALANNASQYEALETFLNETNNSFESMNDCIATVSDEEIDNLISNQAADQIGGIDDEIDTKISQLKEKIGGQYE